MVVIKQIRGIGKFANKTSYDYFLKQKLIPFIQFKERLNCQGACFESKELFTNYTLWFNHPYNYEVATPTEEIQVSCLSSGPEEPFLSFKTDQFGFEIRENFPFTRS